MNQILLLGLPASISIARQSPVLAAVPYPLGGGDAAIRRTAPSRRLPASSSLAQRACWISHPFTPAVTLLVTQLSRGDSFVFFGVPAGSPFPETTGFAARRGRPVLRTSRHKKCGLRAQILVEGR